MTDQFEAKPKPPDSQSKLALEQNVDDEDEASKVNYKELYNSQELLKGCDPILRWAAGDILAKKVEEWAANWTSESEEKLKAHIDSEDTRNEFKKLVMSRWLERRTQETSDKPNERVLNAIDEEITKHLTELITATVQAATKKATAPRDKMSAEQKQREYQHLLWKMRRKHNLYQLLGLEFNAPPEEVNKAYKKMVLLTHPDKNNNDPYAGEVTSELNRAKETLSDPSKRAAYHKFMSDNRVPEKIEGDEWGEGFAENAWGEEGEADFLFDDDDDDDPPPKLDSSTSKLLHKLDDTFRQYFQSEGTKSNSGVKEKIKDVNKEIKVANKSANRDSELYYVQADDVFTMRYFQQRVLTYYQLGQLTPEAAAKEIQFLNRYCKKVCEQGSHQWPLSWVDLVVRPLKDELCKLGWEENEPGNSNDGNGTSGSKQSDTHGENDTEMPDAGDQKPSQTYVPPKPLKPLQPGLTARGEKILGYLPVTRHFRAANISVPISFKLFFETKERQRLGFTESSDPGALAYHRFDKRNHIREPKIDWYALQFKSIKGIAFKSPVMTGERIPDGYLWVDVFEDPQPEREKILTRTEFQHWVTTKSANEYIDSFFCENDLKPPWAIDVDLATAVGAGYAMRYPLPNAGKRGLISHGYMQQPGNQAASLQQLTTSFNQLCLELKHDREARKAELEEHRGMIMKLLEPASK